MNDPPATGKGSRSPHARSARRERILDAFIDIALDESRLPVADEMAERAGVSRATVFRYFESLPELRMAVRRRTLTRFPQLFALPSAGPALDHRIDGFVDARTALYEQLHPLLGLERLQDSRQPDIAHLVATRHRFFERQTREYFEPHLDELDSSRREDLLTAVSILTSFESWDQLRRTLEASAEETNLRWRRIVKLLFADA